MKKCMCWCLSIIVYTRCLVRQWV